MLGQSEAAACSQRYQHPKGSGSDIQIGFYYLWCSQPFSLLEGSKQLSMPRATPP